MANTTTHAVFIPEIWAATALKAFRKFTLMTQLIKPQTDNEFGRVGDIYHIPSINDLTVGTRTEGVAMTFEDGSATEQTVTLSLWDYAAFRVTDLLRIQANQSILDLYMENAMQVLSEKIDARLLGLYASASTTLGTAGTAWTAATMLDLDKRFNDNLVPMDGRILVMGSKGRREYLEFTSLNGLGGVHGEAATVAARAEMVNVYGFRPFFGSQVVSTGSAPVAYHNLAFHPSAFLLATRPLALPEASEGVKAGYASQDGLSLRVLQSFDHATTQHRISIDVLYGTKVLRPTAVVDVLN